MATPRLLEDCQAWIQKGHESWKLYFSKWEGFAKYEENLTETELIDEFNHKQKKRRNKSKRVLKQLLSRNRNRLRGVSHKNRQKIQKRFIKKSKNNITNRTVLQRPSSENLSEIDENKQLEVTLRTTFSNILKSDTNMCKMFAVLFHTSVKKRTIKDSDYLVPKSKVLPGSGFRLNAANFSFENQRILSSSTWKNSLSDRSICPARSTYLQNLRECTNEINFKQTENKWEERGNFKIRIQTVSSADLLSFTNQQILPFSDSQIPQENKLGFPPRPTMLRFRNTALQSIQFDSSPKFPCYQNKEVFKNMPMSKANKTQGSKRLWDFSLSQKKEISIQCTENNANIRLTSQRSSQQNCFNQMTSKRMLPSKKLVFDSNEDDSDSDDQIIYRSPRIHSLKKRLKPNELNIEPLKLDVEDSESIFDRILKS